MNRFPFLDSIVLIWNNPSIPAPNLTNTTLLGSTHRHTLHILPQPKNSVNNRWIDHPDLYKRDCIITMDDDWDFPPENLFLAITAWRTQHFNRLVGYHHLGRSITTETSDNNTKTYTYIPSPDNGISIILPSGMVFHRKYMTEYWSPSLVAARQHVDDTINCDDILINMIVANVTRGRRLR
ncbi:exostosin [Chytridium lagenaria]|nr:exostosin [Chytridium lagenaria]